MKAIEALTSVLCDPEGKCCISGSDDDRRLIDSALAELAKCGQPTQARADGFFLLLPQRPKPEAPAGTAGIDWDAYSGAQMLTFGRDCSDAAIAALRTEQPAPATQQAGESVYAFRRKGLADFCTCDEARYEELSNKPHLFETRIFYTAPQPSPAAQAADSVQEDACHAPPLGWRCTRKAGHEGPCAAVEYEDEKQFVERGMQRIRDAEDAARYRAFRDCSVDDRNRLEHYSGPALDVAVDTFNAARARLEGKL